MKFYLPVLFLMALCLFVSPQSAPGGDLVSASAKTRLEEFLKIQNGVIASSASVAKSASQTISTIVATSSVSILASTSSSISTQEAKLHDIASGVVVASSSFEGNLTDLPILSTVSDKAENTPDQKTGKLLITIETLMEKTPRMISRNATKVEIWTKDSLLAQLSKGEESVEDSFHKRKFNFPPIRLQPGYYFITIKVFAEGLISRDVKFKKRIVQVGIRPGKTTKIQKVFPFFVW